MPSHDRSVSALVIAVILVIAVGGYSWWQRTQKEAEKSKIFRAMAQPVPVKQSTPEEQKALLEAISGQASATQPTHH